jgi:branched-chain amino acid transport system ATP-binding protein
MSLLEVTGLVAGFGPTTVLHGVDLHVEADELACVLGLNGAGKSVTLKVIGGLVPAWKGRVVFDGEDVTSLSVEQRVARGMAFVPQGRQLFPELTVAENLRLGGYLPRRRDRAASDRVLAEVLDRFPRMAQRRDQPAGTLSGGEQAMLAVGRALMARP